MKQREVCVWLTVLGLSLRFVSLVREESVLKCAHIPSQEGRGEGDREEREREKENCSYNFGPMAIAQQDIMAGMWKKRVLRKQREEVQSPEFHHLLQGHPK
jgi:hypothetical protein